MVILALTAIILPVATNQPNAGFGYAVMILFTCLMLPLAVRQVLGRAVGMVFLLGYAAFLVISVVG
jgi:Ca2+/Na+ antiporter